MLIVHFPGLRARQAEVNKMSLNFEQEFAFKNAANSVSLSKEANRKQAQPEAVKSRSCTKPKYNVRLLKSKGVILVLAWNILVFSYQGLVLGTLVGLFPGIKSAPQWIYIILIIFLQSCLPYLIYPICGWIADAKVGRYKVIRVSLWLMWIGALLYLGEEVISYALFDVVLHSDSGSTILQSGLKAFFALITVIIYILNAISIAGFQANIIPFGVDQMEDGSSQQYSAFIHWYYWTRNGSFGLIIQLVLQSFDSYCKTEDSTVLHEVTDRFDLYILLLQVFLVTLAVCLDLLFSNQVLNKDPKVHNPLKKVWDVSKFIVKNDHLVGYRRAITYSYNDPIRRSDFAKKDYGGPFDSDYVEDVKTFWKMLVFIFTLGLGGVFLNNTIYYTLRPFVDHLVQPPPSLLSNCTTRHAISVLVYPMAFTLFIPLYEFFIHPFFRKYIPRMMVRIALGMIVMLLSAIGMFIVDVVGHENATEQSVCMLLRTKGDLSTQHPLSVSMLWAIPLIAVMAVGEMLTFIAALEFLIAQSPFGMRGLLIGVFYAMYGIFNGLVGLLLVFVSAAFKDKSPQSLADVGLHCGSQYYLTTIILGLVGIVLFLLGAVWYKKRQRGGHRTLINHQTVIESYYETSAEKVY